MSCSSVVQFTSGFVFIFDSLPQEATYQNCVASTKRHKVELAMAWGYQMDGSNSMQKSRKSLFMNMK